METAWLGEVEYRTALGIQLERLARRAEGQIPDTLLLLTHPHVFTLGTAGDPSNLLVPESRLAEEGISLERVSRGGDITYHGPGQLVGYPIVLMPKLDLHRYVRTIEAALIEALGFFGIRGERVAGLTGVWADGKKIASIGVGVKRWVTYHGFALNVSPDLSWFDRIRLCGLKDREATSMAQIAGIAPEMDAVREVVAAACVRNLGGGEP